MSTMTVRDVSMLVTSLEYRAESLEALSVGIRRGARYETKFIDVPNNLRKRIHKIAVLERDLSVDLNKLIAKLNVEINI